MYYITNIYALKDIHIQLKHTKTKESKVKEVLKKLFNRQIICIFAKRKRPFIKEL